MVTYGLLAAPLVAIVSRNLGVAAMFTRFRVKFLIRRSQLQVGDRVEDKKTHERGRVTFVYSTLELRGEFIAVLFNGHDEALDVPADSVRKVSTRQS